MNPVALLYSWFQKNSDQFVAGGAELEFRDSGHGSARVRLETSVYLAELCAWDHEKCLDIQVMEIQSEESTFLHTGSCDTTQKFKEHLDEFLTWYKREMRVNA